MQRVVLFSSALVVVVIAVGGACDLFDQVKCSVDSDCPAASPFCTDGVCSKTDGSGRTHTGEGEGEGEGAAGEGEGGSEISCSDDGICESENGGRCYLGSASTAATNTCVPPASDLNAHCETDPDVQGQPRTTDGPVIWDVQATALPGGDGCWSDISFSWYDGASPPAITNGFVELVVNGANLTQAITSADDTTVTIQQACASGVASGHRAGIVLGLGAGHSNVACLPPQP